MIRKALLWIGGLVMRLVDRSNKGIRKPDVIIDREWEEMKERAKRKPYE